MIEKPKATCRCGILLDEPIDTPRERRVPCPTCGSIDRLIVTAIAQKTPGPDGSGESIRVVTNVGRSTSIDLRPEGDMSYEVRGFPRQGEMGSIETCNRFLQRLRTNGEEWGDAIRPILARAADESGVDGVAFGPDSSAWLEMQVTRAQYADTMAYTLGRVGVTGNDAEFTDEDAAGALHAAIKRKEGKTLQRDRTKMVLLLDAEDCPGLALRSVIAAFRRRYGAWVDALGFRCIWVIGPTIALMARLDEEKKS